MICYYGFYAAQPKRIPFYIPDSSFTRKPSLVASECLNLKSFLGLTRQRSEINLSNLGLIGSETRRSRSEVRGISCDRLTIGYHTPSTTAGTTQQAGNTSPPNKSGCWLRGRKKEREVRCPLKISADVIGKTVVTGSNNKRTNSKSCDTRTVADQSGGSKTKKPSSKLNTKGKSNKKGSNENLLDEDIYVEIGHLGQQKEKLLKDNKAVVKGPTKASRKKGQAPKPNVNLKESNCDVNLNPNGVKDNGNCFVEKKNSPHIKPTRKLQSGSGKNEEKQTDNRIVQTSKINNMKNSEAFLTVKNKINSDSSTHVTVAEIHKNMTCDSKIEKKKNSEDFRNNNLNENIKPLEIPVAEHNAAATSNSSNDPEFAVEKERMEEVEIEIPPFRIDTPDYSTLESVFEKNQNDVIPDKHLSVTSNKDVTCLDNGDINYYNINNLSSDTIKLDVENSISSILRDSSGDSKYSEVELIPKKMVRFEKLDLIETYKKNKAESVKDSDEDSIISVSDKKPSANTLLDVNSNEIMPYNNDLGKLKVESPHLTDAEVLEKLIGSSSDCVSVSSSTSSTEMDCSQKDMTVNVLIRNPSPELSNNIEDAHLDEAQTQLVVKKSIVLTIAKQEKGFQSMCASKKPEAIKIEPPKNDHKISVTFLCSDSVENVPPPPPSMSKPSVLRVRSASESPQNQLKIEVPPPLPPPLRGRSRERRSKDRQHCKKNHKSRKKNKEDAFHMPQAVIDELSQVLEKRKPSLDKKTPMQAS
ncbi:hypothetical protein CDAR_79812 [Caerostris darwini]|uniref:Uncharacterized protein n=1 Tax=Caerostris darwini TaxID=1538125 RepID=A0AAV4SPA0_9ARAC|nr:hypothetical protein CDAR_79812 [Caerostris darwini]